MLNWFKKKSVLEKLIDKVGFEHATAGFVHVLTTQERAAVATLETEARGLLKKHYAVVDVLQAKLWIAATLTSESSQPTVGLG